MVVAGKKALLLIDNFSAHKLGVEQMEEAGELRATKVVSFILNVFFAFLTNLILRNDVPTRNDHVEMHQFSAGRGGQRCCSID